MSWAVSLYSITRTRKESVAAEKVSIYDHTHLFNKILRKLPEKSGNGFCETQRHQGILICLSGCLKYIVDQPQKNRDCLQRFILTYRRLKILRQFIDLTNGLGQILEYKTSKLSSLRVAACKTHWKILNSRQYTRALSKQMFNKQFQKMGIQLNRKYLAITIEFLHLFVCKGSKFWSFISRLIYIQEMCWHQSQCQYVLQDSQGRYILFEDYIQSQPNQNNRGKQVQQQNLFKSNENQDFQFDGQVHLTSIQDIEQQLNRQDINMKLPKNDAKQKCYHEECEPDESIQENETHQNGQIKRSKMIKKESTHKDTQTPPQSTKNNPKSGEVQQDQRSCQNSTRGRPHKDQQARRHLQISRQFNHIYEHYARLLIYFYMMKKQDDQDSHSLSLQLHQNAWINQATEIMNIDNFPKDTNLRGQCFLLHPNSLHFIFQFNKKKKVLRYSSQQIKFYFFAFLGKRGLLTSSIYNYICQYWTDIVCLLNEWTFQQNRTRKEAYGRRLYIQYEQEADRPSDTRSQLESELKADPSIAAYEVACYLKCCCDYFGIQISLPKKQ